MDFLLFKWTEATKKRRLQVQCDADSRLHLSVDPDAHKYVSNEAQLCSPVLQQSVLWDLVVGHRFPEGVNLLKNELSDL